jgi:hypothetical protein
VWSRSSQGPFKHLPWIPPHIHTSFLPQELHSMPGTFLAFHPDIQLLKRMFHVIIMLNGRDKIRLFYSSPDHFLPNYDLSLYHLPCALPLCMVISLLKGKPNGIFDGDLSNKIFNLFSFNLMKVT